MAERSSANSAGITFFGGLALLFIALKLLGMIDWSWWWVLSPIWGGALFVLIAFAALVLFFWVVTRRDQRFRNSPGSR